MQASDTHDAARADDETNHANRDMIHGLGDGDGTDGDECTRIRCDDALYICTGWESKRILARRIPGDDVNGPTLVDAVRCSRRMLGDHDDDDIAAAVGNAGEDARIPATK